MADLKISALTASTTPLAGTEILPIVQSSATKKVSVADLTAGRAVSMSTLAVGVATGNGPAEIDGVNVVLAASNYGTLNLVCTSTATAGFGTQFNFLAKNNTGGVSPYVVGSVAGRWNGSGYQGYLSLSTTDNVGNPIEQVIINHVGDLGLRNGNLVQGTAAKGINFTANTPAAGMTSQLLNWYEEGTWTPGYSVTGGTITADGSASGKYTRIGRVVHIWGYISWGSSTGTPIGALTVTGLPFTAGSGFGQSNVFSGGISTIQNQLWLTNQPSHGKILASGTSINMLRYDATGSTDVLYSDMNTAFSNASQWSFYGSYEV